MVPPPRAAAPERSLTDTLHTVARLELPVGEWQWPFARDRAAEIAGYFSELQAETPQLWNGGVLMARNPQVTGDCFRADYFPTDFASLLALRGWGFPDRSVFNVFGMGALRSSDGAFVLGEMGRHTANAGKIYFPAGTPDLQDVRDGILDMAASVEREVDEEVGLRPSDYDAAPHWTCVFAGPRVALIRELRSPLAAEALLARIEAAIAVQDEPELLAIHLVRSATDITSAVPPFVAAYLRNAL